jgi:hypothetical protein
VYRLGYGADSATNFAWNECSELLELSVSIGCVLGPLPYVPSNRVIRRRTNVEKARDDLRDNDDLPPGLAKPARRALTRAGYSRLEQFTKLSEEEVLQLHGMGPKALDQIRRALAAKGLSFADGSRGTP